MDLEESLTYSPKDSDISKQADLIRNGIIQKFEYTVELMWKTAKFFLLSAHGIDVASPKRVIKSLYQYSNLSEEQYLELYEILEWRNRLSHVYKKEMFLKVYPLIPTYYEVLKTAESCYIDKG